MVSADRRRGRLAPGDAARGRRLFALLRDKTFYCPACGGTHPLAGHQACRDGAAAWLAESTERSYTK